MKKLILFILSCSFIFSNCGDDVQSLFNYEYEVDFTIPPGLNTIDTHVFTVRDVPSFFLDVANANGIVPDSIKSIAPNRATITSIFQGIRFDFVESVSIWMLSSNNPTDLREIFFLDFVQPDEDQEIQLFSSIANALDYLKAGKFDIEIRLRFRSPSPTEIDGRLFFDLTAFE